MTNTRRDFLSQSAVTALGMSALPSLVSALETRPSAPRVARAAAPLDILILGGTGFTGPEQVEYATARGHRVTLFNRNRTRPDFFKGRVEQLIGDLSGDVSALAGKSFDVVIDNPTTLPFWVRNAAQHLAGHTKHYLFISTMSVYPDNSVPGRDETDGVTPLPAGLDAYTTSMDDARRHYGALKTAAELEVQRHYGDRCTIIRPGLIVGPLDRSDRFTYWPVRIDRGGEVLAPGTPNDPTQIIDARDLAEWMIRLAEDRVLGTFNACGPAAPLTMGEMLAGIKAVTSSGAQFTWVPADFLRTQQVQGWRHMPVWLPPEGATAGFMRRSNARAVAAGLAFRPLAVTAKDTLDWHKTRPASEQEALANGTLAGISSAREAEVLAAWRG
jgi:2'-hydroxyisoflavone reductase